MDILKNRFLPQIVFIICGTVGAAFMVFLPGKQWWDWLLVGLTVFMVTVAVKEIHDSWRLPHVKASEPQDLYTPIIPDEHILLRSQILDRLKFVKLIAQPYGPTTFTDGYALRFADTESIVLCAITIDSHSEYDSVSQELRAYDIDRMYCISKSELQPIRTVCDATFINNSSGQTQVDTWLPIDNQDWTVSDEHIASVLELKELNDYLQAILENS